jgi:PIN domain nuclease of toxin-antitoxin system
MSAVFADTHAVIWYLFEPTKLSPAAEAALTGAVRSGAVIYVSSLSVVEVRYLVEKFKLPPTTYDDLVTALNDPASPVKSLPVDLDVARAVERIPRDIVPDLPDRIIAATALTHNLPLVTSDRKIQAAPITTIW